MTAPVDRVEILVWIGISIGVYVGLALVETSIHRRRRRIRRDRARRRRVGPYAPLRDFPDGVGRVDVINAYYRPAFVCRRIVEQIRAANARILDFGEKIRGLARAMAGLSARVDDNWPQL